MRWLLNKFISASSFVVQLSETNLCLIVHMYTMLSLFLCFIDVFHFFFIDYSLFSAPCAILSNQFRLLHHQICMNVIELLGFTPTQKKGSSWLSKYANVWRNLEQYTSQESWYFFSAMTSLMLNAFMKNWHLLDPIC